MVCAQVWELRSRLVSLGRVRENLRAAQAAEASHETMLYIAHCKLYIVDCTGGRGEQRNRARARATICASIPCRMCSLPLAPLH